MTELEGLKRKIDLTSEVDKNLYHCTILLLEIYQKVLFRVKREISMADEECYVAERKRLSDLVGPLVEFNTQKDKKSLYDRLISLQESLALMEIMEDALLALRDYPDRGKLYADILRYRYFEFFANTHEEIQEICRLSRSTYFRARQKAINSYAVMLWAFTLPELRQRLPGLPLEVVSTSPGNPDRFEGFAHKLNHSNGTEKRLKRD
ncbi:MAG: hypothetical protein ABF904_14165 [Ethanoligenens sp.]